MELAELVHAAGEGDQKAWNAIVERFGGLVWATVPRAPAQCGRRRRGRADDLAAPRRAPRPDPRSRAARRLARGDGAERVPATDPARRARGPERDGCIRERRRQRPRSEPPEDRARPGVLEGIHRTGRSLPDAPARADGGPEPSYQEVSAALAMPIGAIGPTRRRCLERLAQDPQLAAFGEAR